MSIISLMRGMSLTDIDAIWLLSLVFLLMRIIANFLRYTGYLYSKKTLQSKKDGKDQEYIQLSTTTDPGYHMGHGKVTKSQLDITDKSQEASPFPTGDHKAAMNRPESMTNTRHK